MTIKLKQLKLNEVGLNKTKRQVIFLLQYNIQSALQLLLRLTRLII